MSLSAVLSSIHFYDGTESWALSNMMAMTSTEQSDFLAKISYLYTESQYFKTLLDDFVQNGDSFGNHVLNILGGWTTATDEASNLIVNVPGGGQINAYYFVMDELGSGPINGLPKRAKG